MPLPTFADLIETMRGFQESRVLLTAVELDIFTAVGRKATVAEVSAKLGTDPRATGMLLHALAAIGALTKRDGVFRNTPETARYLAAGSPDYAQPAMMHTVHQWKNWSTLTECVRAGTAVLPPGIERQERAWTQSFIAAMHRRAAAAAAELLRLVDARDARRMLDVGGGSGAFSIEFAKANRHLRAVVFDVPAVVRIAQKHIAEAGLSDRVTTRVGDLRRDELGKRYDLILLSAICHMLSAKENQDLFRRCRRALAPGGRLLVRDLILEPDRTAPRPAALFALNMLVSTRGGATYTEDEYESWLAAAGFDQIARPDPGADLMLACRSRKTSA